MTDLLGFSVIEFGWSQLKRYCSEARVFRLSFIDPETQKKRNVSIGSPHLNLDDIGVAQLDDVSIFNQSRKQLMDYVIPLATRSVPESYFLGAKKHIAQHLKQLLESSSKLLDATISPEDALRAHVKGVKTNMSVREYLREEKSVLG